MPISGRTPESVPAAKRASCFGARRAMLLAGLGLAILADGRLTATAEADPLGPPGTTTLFVLQGHVGLTPRDPKTGAPIAGGEIIVPTGQKATTSGTGGVVQAAMLPAERARLERELRKLEGLAKRRTGAAAAAALLA